MPRSCIAIAYLDAPRFARALAAGTGRLLQHREHLNKINVFPVPDHDTGTNMVFTLKTILAATVTSPDSRFDDLMDRVADAALAGARGSAGAIMAQFLHGFRESVTDRLLAAEDLALAVQAGASTAWTAMSSPVTGTLPTVLEDFSAELDRQVAQGVRDIRLLLRHGLERARESLANTPRQLAALKQAGVVDAGGQGFVDLLEGIWSYVDSGVMDQADGDFGAITQQKTHDAKHQRSMLNLTGETAIVVDSGGDLPALEAARLGIQVVPVRLSFGDREYLDGVSLTAKEFYRMLAESEEAPLTSQPPPQDFSRVYSLLTEQGYAVVYVGLSGQLSGTISAGRQAARRSDAGEIRVVDSLSATAGQGLLAMVAAEAAATGMSAEAVEALVLAMVPRTQVMGIADDLSYAVRGGRVPAWFKRVTDWLHFNPVLTASREGKIKLGGFLRGRGARPAALARNAVRKMEPDTIYRVLIAHMDNEKGASKTRRHILEGHGRIHSCHITEAGPALGVHLGPGGLVVGFIPQPIELG